MEYNTSIFAKATLMQIFVVLFILIVTGFQLKAQKITGREIQSKRRFATKQTVGKKKHFFLNTNSTISSNQRKFQFGNKQNKHANPPKVFTRLGIDPEFGNSHGLSTVEFFEKLRRKYYSNYLDRKFLDKIFAKMGYPNGFLDADASLFSDAKVARGTVGNMGFSKKHKSIFAILDARGPDMEAFRIKAANGCDVHFMKTCGNHFFFCPGF